MSVGTQNRDRDQPTHPHELGHADCAQVFRQAIVYPLTGHPHGPDGPDVKFEVVYGVSDSNWPLYDLEHGRRSIGYNPQQKSIVTDDFAAGHMDRDPVLHANL